MLSKLLKYEFKATGRIYGGLYLAILAAAALLGAFFRFPALASDFPIVVVTTVYLMLCVAIAVITALTIIQRFTRNLLGREGYLMHTLPVTPAQLILSKLISSMVWLLCSILVIALSLGVFFLCGMLNVNGIFSDWASAVRDFRQLADILQHVLNVSGFMLLLTAIEWLATLVCSILCLYTACMIGHQFKQHFALVGIAAFVILNIVQNRLVALLPYTNNKMVPSCTAGKILWMRENEPALFARTRAVVNPKDYVRTVLTGVPATDESDASGFGVYDVRNHRWNRELLDLIGLPEEVLPPVFHADQAVGTVLPEVAAELGLGPDTVVVAGAGDAIMQTVGSGAVEEGVYSVVLGSGGLIRAYSTGASIAVKAASKARIVPCGEYRIVLDYPQLGSFQILLASVQGEQVVARGDELFKAVDLILQLLGAHLIGLRALDVVPEAVLMRLGLEPRDLVLGGFDIEGLLKVFKRVAHGEQLLLIGIVFDNSHGDLLFSYCISRKSISYRRAKGKKNPPRRRIFPIFYRQRCKLPHKNKKSTHPCVVPFWSLSAR